MELHRKRSFGAAAVMAIIGVGLLALIRPDSVAGWVFLCMAGGGAILIALYLFAGSIRPFRLAIGPTGLDVYTSYVKRQLAWSEIESLSIEAAGNGFALYAALKADDHGAEKIKLVDLGDVRERPEAVAAALSEHAGPLFIMPPQAAEGLRPDFTVVLRGYDIQQVDGVLRECLDLSKARAAIDRFTAAPVIALRGYDREQVTEYFGRLRAQLDAPNSPPLHNSDGL